MSTEFFLFYLVDLTKLSLLFVAGVCLSMSVRHGRSRRYCRVSSDHQRREGWRQRGRRLQMVHPGATTLQGESAALLTNFNFADTRHSPRELHLHSCSHETYRLVLSCTKITKKMQSSPKVELLVPPSRSWKWNNNLWSVNSIKVKRNPEFWPEFDGKLVFGGGGAQFC